MMSFTRFLDSKKPVVGLPVLKIVKRYLQVRTAS